MKKVIFSGIVGFLCVCAVGTGAVMLAKNQTEEVSELAEEDLPPMEVEIPVGRYYHTVNGVKDEDFYIEVTEEKTIQTVCDDPVKYCVLDFSDYPEDELEELVAVNFEEYGRVNDYIARYFPNLDHTGIYIDWVIDENGGFAGYGYSYADENVIKWGFTDGVFVLE
ncbi:MAG: hypothetical protein K2O14_14655 [Oscillospiraceae bacterium]|nr:hypothetical protein [Oscillospiraceae bacterium]